MVCAGAKYPNITLFACDGNSDDLDVPIRAIFNDAAFSAANNVCSLNSINVSRKGLKYFVNFDNGVLLDDVFQ